MEKDNTSEEEKEVFLKWAHEYQDRFNTGYQLAKQLDDPEKSEEEKRSLRSVSQAIEQSKGDGDWLKAMKEGMQRYEHDRGRDKVKSQLRKTREETPPKDQSREIDKER